MPVSLKNGRNNIIVAEAHPNRSKTMYQTTTIIIKCVRSAKEYDRGKEKKGK